MNYEESLEYNILSGIVKSHKLSTDFCLQYNNDLFLDAKNRCIANIIISYVRAYKSKPNKEVILEYCQSYEEKELLRNFWDNLNDYDEDNYNFDVECLINRYASYKFGVLKDKINVLDGKKAIEDIKYIQQTINEIKATEKGNVFTKKTLKEYLGDFREGYKAKHEKPELGKGILTGYSCLDYIKNGLRPADLIIICGETGAGKSMMLNNMAINMWKQSNTLDTPVENFKRGYNVAYFSLEMPYADCFQRTMAALSDVPEYHLRDAKLSRSEAAGVSKACNFIKHFPYEFDIIDVPRNFTVEQLELYFQQIKAKYTPDVLFIDYMGLMDDIDDPSQDWLKLGQLAGKIHEFARNYNIPIVTATQLNRMEPSKRKEHKSVGLHRIGRSSLIAHHATVIIQIDNSSEFAEDINTFKYHIIKNRHGRLADHSIIKNFDHCLIQDLPYDIEADSMYIENEDITKALSSVTDDISDILIKW